jgi:ribosome recycling factor
MLYFTVKQVKDLKGKIGEDDIKQLTKAIEGVSEKSLEQANKMFKAKETELLKG